MDSDKSVCPQKKKKKLNWRILCPSIQLETWQRRMQHQVRLDSSHFKNKLIISTTNLAHPRL